MILGRFIEWAAKIGTKTECVLCICNISISRKRQVETLKMIVFYFLTILLYSVYIYKKDKAMTIFTQNTLINYSSIKTPHYPIFQTLRMFLIGNAPKRRPFWYFFHWNFFRFEQLTREYDVKFFNCFESTATFKTIFNHLKSRTIVMRYFEGQKRALYLHKNQMI